MSNHFLIVGQGLAGTTLAWHLWQRSQEFQIVDSAEPVTASRIAAGLVTPVTGKRQVLSRDWSLYWPAADSFYRGIEEVLQSRFWEVCGAVRWFLSEQEREQFERRRETEEYPDIEFKEHTPIVNDAVYAPLGGYRMEPAARLDLPRYLDGSREFFDRKGMYRRATIATEDCQLKPTSVHVPELNQEFSHVIWCTGFCEFESCRFPTIDFRPVKGEILTISLPCSLGRDTWHFGGWLAPVANDDHVFRAGSTYDWEQLDSIPTAAARERILGQLGQIATGPPSIENHLAAIRPAVSDAAPVIGRQPEFPRFAILNGLGAKGTLWAPRSAAQLTAALLDDAPIPQSVSCLRWQR